MDKELLIIKKHYRKIGLKAGHTTFSRHGKEHYQRMAERSVEVRRAKVDNFKKDAEK